MTVKENFSNMPACANESLSQLWKKDQMNPEIRNGNGSGSSIASTSPPSPASPVCTSPQLTLQRIPSALLLAQASRTLSPSPIPPPEPETYNIFRWIIVLWFRIIKNIISTIIYLVWSQILIGPTLWVSAWIWVVWKAVSLPLTLIKWCLTMIQTSPDERSRKKRTVLISGGSTVQALHLARNFYSAGARVIVCEVEGYLGLTRFSTAVHKFYTLPKPSAEKAQEYVQALCNIIETEHVHYYIPVSATNAAFYDALARPHIEVLNCVVFCPNVKEVRILDDMFEVLSRCRGVGMPTPLYYHITTIEDIFRLYDSGILRTGRHFMSNVGHVGIRDRVKMHIPPFRQDFRTSQEISESKPWVIVQDLVGEHYVTCTTIKESHVVANVTCRVEKDRGGLVPIENEEIIAWIRGFIHKLKLRNLSGHFSFRFVISAASNTIVPIGCKVGVTLPYICHTSVHPRMIWKPCPHFSRRASGPLVSDKPKYWMHDAVLTTLKHPSVEAVGKLIGTVLDKREVLFVYWDPLPYWVYYHLQLPYRNVLQFIHGHRNHHIQRTLVAPVQ